MMATPASYLTWCNQVLSPRALISSKTPMPLTTGRCSSVLRPPWILSRELTCTPFQLEIAFSKLSESPTKRAEQIAVELCTFLPC